jgi:hypothetical protein
VAPARRHELPPRLPRLLPAAQLLSAAVGVEDVELVPRPREPALLELPGHRKQPLAGERDVVARGRASPGVRARSSVREDASREDEPLLPVRPQLGERLEPLLVEQAVGQVEFGLDVRVVTVRPDERRVTARAKQEPDRLREDRLAGPGLTGDRVQASPQLELRVADQDEVVDAQPAQHADDGTDAIGARLLTLYDAKFRR